MKSKKKRLLERIVNQRAKLMEQMDLGAWLSGKQGLLPDDTWIQSAANKGADLAFKGSDAVQNALTPPTRKEKINQRLIDQGKDPDVFWNRVSPPFTRETEKQNRAIKLQNAQNAEMNQVGEIKLGDIAKSMNEQEGPMVENDIIDELTNLLQSWPDKQHPYYADVAKLLNKYTGA
jgi:hypothetical protein